MTTSSSNLPGGRGFKFNPAIQAAAASWLRLVQVGLEYDNIQRVPDWLKKQTGESSILSGAQSVNRPSGRNGGSGSSGPKRPQMNLREVMEEVRLSRTTITRLMKEGLFPLHHYNSPGRRFWYADEIRDYQRRAPDRKPDPPKSGKPKGHKRGTRKN